MKKIMIIMLSLLLIAPVMAAVEGNILTQNQIDNVNLENYDFEPSWVTSKVETIASCFVYPVGRCERSYSYLSVIPEFNISKDYGRILTGNYVVKLFTKRIMFDLQKFIDIRTETNSTNAKQKLKQYVNGRTDRQFTREKGRLTNYQTKQIEDAEDIFGNWEF